MKNILNNFKKLDELSLSLDQKKMLNDVDYDQKDQTLLSVKIREYLTKGYPIEVLARNWKEIRMLGRNSSSKDSFITRYGEELGEKMFDRKTKLSVVTKEILIEKYGEEAAVILLKSRGQSLKNYINRWGEQNGTQKWNEYNKKRIDTFKQGRKIGKYASRDLTWFQKKYGINKGYEVWDAKRKAQAFKVSTKGYIEKYGEEIGRAKIKESKSRGEEYYVKKYDEEIGRKKFIDYCRKVSAAKTNSVSKWSIDCCEEIKKTIKDLKYYGINEITIGLTKLQEQKIGQKIMRPDLFYKGKIIEFQGDLFHGNPSLFENTDCPHPYNKLTQLELRNIDQKKIEFYNSKGWEVLEIWENDYKLNKKEIINQCIQFLTKTTK